MFNFLKLLTKTPKSDDTAESKTTLKSSVVPAAAGTGTIVIRPKPATGAASQASAPKASKAQAPKQTPKAQKASAPKSEYDAEDVAPKVSPIIKSAERKAAEPRTPVNPVAISESFRALGLEENLLQALADQGYETPTPIQTMSIPIVLARKDLFGCAQTGTGKTASFALPIIQHLQNEERPANRKIRALVVAPTRELALQIHENFEAYGAHSKIKSIVIFGGVGQQPQVDKLRQKPDVVIATTGRLLDLIGQGYVDLASCAYLVLDEADKMLDMGFIHDIRRLMKVLPKERQTLFFSATMPKEIRSLANEILQNPEEVSVTPVATTAERIEQKVYFVGRSGKGKLLEHLLETDESMNKVLIFTRTKRGANKVAETLTAKGIKSAAIHGNKSQAARQKALDSFRHGTIRVLVASDLAARGLDLDDISHVINFEIPEVPETYVHRIGRTGRASASGIALTFCSSAERAYFTQIERTTKADIQVVQDHPFPETGVDLEEKPYVHNNRGQRPSRPSSRPSSRSQGGGRPVPRSRN